jgi:hypothetical protein
MKVTDNTHINIKEQFLGIYAPVEDDTALTQDEFYEKLNGRSRRGNDDPTNGRKCNNNTTHSGVQRAGRFP